MNAHARDLSDATTLGETLHYESPRNGSSRPSPGGIDPMPYTPDKAAPQRYTFASGSRPLDGYTIKRAIGRGGFGEVYYATSDAGKEVALKLITRNLEVERRGVVQCMNLKSANLVAIHDLKQNDAGDSFVIMEFVNGPSLAQILAQHPAGLPADQIRMWLKGLVDGVAYLHDHGIVHRDLKPANLFLEEGVVKIGDYGLSKAITGGSRDPEHSECVGTCHYMAPETSTGKYHKSIDIYAIGVILYEMVTGRVPFDGESVGEVLMKHLTSRPDLTVLPEPFKQIVGRALAKDPNHRPQRVADLLLPGDARREPEMRFIGEKNAPETPPVADRNGRQDREEEIVRIVDEEPVFYIGPDTRPPQPRQRPGRGNGWLWGGNAARRAAQARQASLRRPVPPPAAARPIPPVAARPVAPPPPPRPATPPPPLGPPPPLPDARARVAELSGSMVAAAPVTGLGAALLTSWVMLANGANSVDPRAVAVTFGMALLATWMHLIAGKVWEGKNADSRLSRRLRMAGFGALVGLSGAGLAATTNLIPAQAAMPRTFDPAEFTLVPSEWRPLAALATEYAAFFGLSGLLVASWKGVARDRKSRLRLVPVVWAALVGTVLGGAFPAVMPFGPIAVGVTALATQLVSPYSREASQYAREAARRAA